MKSSDFGRDFLWGVATSAAQIEGAAFKEGRTASIWDQFSQNKSKIKDQSNTFHTCDFYHRYEEDIYLCKILGFKVFRFSVSWSRILPRGKGEVNEAGISFYNKVIDTCLRLGLVPMLTLYHWDLPNCLQESGGWAGFEVLNAFREYVTLCAKRFGDRVKHWLILNEPFGFTSLGYLLGIHAPGQRSLKDFFQAIHHVALAQAEGGHLLRQWVPQAQIGTTFSCSKVLPYTNSADDQKAANRIDALVNRLFIEPSLGLDFPTVDNWDFLEKFKINFSTWRFKEAYKFGFDFIGLQNYFPLVVKYHPMIPWVQAWEVNAQSRGVSTTAMGWENNPQAFVDILREFVNRYPSVKSWIITEHGAFFKDQLIDGQIEDDARVVFFDTHLKVLHQAITSGLPVKGYLVWTLMDNFEWVEGNVARFGIIYNDFKTQKRTIKKSGFWWQNFLSM